MAELLFPVAAVLVTFLVIIPALTLISRAALARVRRRAASWAGFGSETTFALLVAPMVLPVLWLTSSALHQTEPLAARGACRVDHLQATTCWDAALLLGLMLVGMAVSAGRRARRERVRVRVDRLPGDAPAARRVAAIVDADPHLRRLRVLVARGAAAPVFTVGWFRPRVILDACFVTDSDDDVLYAALLHERAHIAGFDTVRGFVARLCLGANPAGHLLAPDFDRWRHAREAQCDGEAVHRGGQALALAEGIVRAARFGCRAAGAAPVAHLCGHDAATLKLRLALLLEGPPRPVRTAGHLLLGACVLAALVLPHVPNLGALELFHFEVERLLHLMD